MSVFAIADLHLPGGGEINKSMDMFGPRWQDHKSRIDKNWCAVVGDGDTVVVGGDISWAMTLDDALDDLRFLDSLPGEKIILEGNHDYWWTTKSKLESFFAKNSIGTLRILRGNAYLRDGFAICGTRGWFGTEAAQNRAFDADFEKLVRREAERLRTSVKEALVIADGDTSRVRAFTHFPAAFGGDVCEPILDVLRETGVTQLYFGHVHGVYDYPPTYEYGTVFHSTIAADYLSFVPRLVR